MKYTGVVRRVDELGRIVIPKEIRKTAKIKDGDPLEFTVDNESIIIKRYYPLEKWVSYAQYVANSIKEILEKECLVVDQNKVVASSQSISDSVEKIITENLISLINKKQTVVLSKQEGAEFLTLIPEKDFNESTRIIVPIIYKENSCGAIIVLGFDETEELSTKDVNSIRICANLLSEHFN